MNGPLLPGLQRVLTHPDAKAVGVDPWLMTTKLSSETMDEVRRRAHQNVEPWQGVFGNKCTLIRGSSAEVLRLMLKNKFGYAGIKRGSLDLCMVDGDHNELGVLDDCRLVWQLLKPGGWMIADDVENDKPKAHHVKEGLAAFLAETPGAELVVKKDYIECYRKA
jgi:predicted O-methyltransferase YrrM